MGMEHWWNDTDRGKLKYWERNIIQCGWYVNEWVWSIGGMILIGGGTKLMRENPLPVTLCPLQISHGLGSKPCLRGVRPATDRLSHGAV